jgi:methyl-accepting chemotaxis protein
VVSRISRLVQHLNEIANGDSNLSVRLHSQSQDELGQMANAFNRFVSKIAISMNDTITAASQLDHNAAELKQSAESTFQVASRQQALLLQLNDSLEQTGASSGHVQQHIENSQQTMQAVSDKTEAINQLAQNNREATQDLIDEVTATTAHIEQLNHDSQTINDVMGSINEIAAQTNLLALNAAIEAARAGEQGRGFAVVADEVRALASKTQESTEKIQSQVTNLQSNTKEAADSIQATQTATSAQLRQSAEISNVFAVIQHDILSLKQQNNEVENLSHQQMAKIETAEQHLQEMIAQVEQNLAAAEQTLSASDELFVLSRSLQKTMGQFAG